MNRTILLLLFSACFQNFIVLECTHGSKFKIHSSIQWKFLQSLSLAPSLQWYFEAGDTELNFRCTDKHAQCYFLDWLLTLCSACAQRVLAPQSMPRAGGEEAEGQLSSHISVWNVLCSEPRKEPEQCTVWSWPLKTPELVGETGHPCASRWRTVQRQCVIMVHCEPRA